MGIRTHKPPCLPSKTPIERDRLSAARRGYDRRWARYRTVFLRQNPICVQCGEIASEVDHIRPVVNGQSDQLFWMGDNHQALCKRCHSAKTLREVRERAKLAITTQNAF